ncbi:General transcription factor II-I repeat domain-containing protein 2 [Thelohanellus kitauei]|uniref:General transcription factor II-I repeat domain-containing protein 2 n=1 Tax=Thelohanellus kitauei TaxID=669202 RepID=A0A0C2NDE6_THEKT|nr:General transcription factor II-I repeat domain-containing protein 2 [Thelohanellus kitauei]
MAMDESDDISDTTNVLVIFLAVNKNVDLVGLESSHSTTKGSDLLETLENPGEKNNMECGKSVSICPDGAMAMMGSKSRRLTLLEQFLDRPIHKYHCIRHLETLCGKALNLKNVMDVVVRCVKKNPQRFSEPARVQAVYIGNELGTRRTTPTL